MYLAESVAAADVGERRSRVGVLGEILQVDDAAATLAGGGQGRDPHGMRDHVRVEAQRGDIAFNELEHGPGRHRRVGEAIPAHAACRSCCGKQRPGRVVGEGAIAPVPRVSAISPRFWPLTRLESATSGRGSLEC
jgi:hypothetical protein